MDSDELDELAAQKAFGYKFSEVSNRVGEAHDLLFQEAEIEGDLHGSKLGVKLAAATNYCDLDITAGDELTQRIILEDNPLELLDRNSGAEFLTSAQTALGGYCCKSRKSIAPENGAKVEF